MSAITDARKAAEEVSVSVRIERAEAAMLQMPQADCQVVHHFGPGVYMREVSIPAGVFAVGHRQRFAHQNVMIKGRVLMFHDDGTKTELCAPLTFVGLPGRKVGYVIEDMVWLNVYATGERDIDKLESTLLEKSETWAANESQRMAAEVMRHEEDRADFDLMLSDVGFSAELVRQQSEDAGDRIDWPSQIVRVMPSPIEGLGVFCGINLEPGDIVAAARVGGMRAPAGRYTNHAKSPNARMVMRPNGDIDLVATRAIRGSAGGQPGDEVTVDYRQAVEETRKALS